LPAAPGDLDGAILLVHGDGDAQRPQGGDHQAGIVGQKGVGEEAVSIRQRPCNERPVGYAFGTGDGHRSIERARSRLALIGGHSGTIALAVNASKLTQEHVKMTQPGISGDSKRANGRFPAKADRGIGGTSKWSRGEKSHIQSARLDRVQLQKTKALA
jgi:hypothetical protein